MKHVIIGTAGHIDHGKTMLIKALTGIDTDRLAEEKKRGITIELGFAHIEFDDGTQAGIIDVPGHEKFIKNMLAGAGGIDLAMLVIAADEGVMPQTREHLNILSLLGIKEGVIVLTKCDLADEEWIEMVSEDIAEQVKGTFFEGKPIMQVSSNTGQGVPELRDCLHDLVIKTEEKNTRTPFRLPVDRVFSADGFGTIVTGTLIEGVIKENDPVELMPSGIEARVRKIQVHGQEEEAAFAGQRVAVNLAGVKTENVSKGEILSKPGSLGTGMMLDVQIANLPSSGRIIKDNSMVHVYYLAKAYLGKVALLGQKELKPGESCFAQLRFQEPVSAKAHDRFVIRFFSPLETIGGGIILDDNAVKHKRNDKSVIQDLEVRVSGAGDEIVQQAVRNCGLKFPSREDLEKILNRHEEGLEEDLQSLLDQGKIFPIMEGRYVEESVLDMTLLKCREVLQDYHRQHPLIYGMSRAELRQKLFAKLDKSNAEALLDRFVDDRQLKSENGYYALPEFDMKVDGRRAVIRKMMLQTYEKAGIEVPDLEEVYSQFSPKEQLACTQVFEHLVFTGELKVLTPKISVSRKAYQGALDIARGWFGEHDEMTLAEYRDLLKTSRKYALALLDDFDRERYTKKVGDTREKGVMMNK